MLTMYSKNPCPNCVTAEQHLKQHNIEYKKVMIVADGVTGENTISRSEFMKAFPTVRVAPYFVDEDGNTYLNYTSVINELA